MKLTPSKIILFLIFILALVALAYWQFFVRTGSPDLTTNSGNQPGGFVPLDRPGGQNNGGGSTIDTGSGSGFEPATTSTQGEIPALRLLSDTPVGGYGASTTGPVNAKPASTTTSIRWVDRGRGNIYEALGDTLNITTLSNTVVPKIYESLWNKNLTSFIALTLSDQGDETAGIYAELKKRVLPKVSTSTEQDSASNDSASLTPYELKGKSLPDNVVAYAVSPKKDRIFLFTNNNEVGTGYTANFDGSSPVQIFTTPITQINVEWPSDNVIAITTKGSASERGFLYFVDPKTGVWKKILGPLPGLSTKVSTDAKYVFVSVAGSSKNIVTSIYDVTKKQGVEGVIRTLADKCIWGNFYKEVVYCAVPSQPTPGTYPDDWYKGVVSFVDKIWQVNAITQEIKLISTIVDTSDRVIDAFNLGLDPKDDFLIFMNKNDLSLWSLDLVAGN